MEFSVNAILNSFITKLVPTVNIKFLTNFSTNINGHRHYQAYIRK